MDKIEELKKLLWILDSKHNVSIPQTKENIDYISDEIVKLFCQPPVSGSLPSDEEITNAANNHQLGGYEWQAEKRKSFELGAKWARMVMSAELSEGITAN